MSTRVYIKVLEGPVWSLQHQRELVKGEVVEMDKELLHPDLFTTGVLEDLGTVLPKGVKLGVPKVAAVEPVPFSREV
jgi:hypothetical protein